MARARLVGLALVLASSTALAQPGMTDATTAPAPEGDGRDTDRVMVGGGIAMFANYPMSMEDPGIGIYLAKPLWLGTRYRYFQWAADVNALVGFGTDSMHAYAFVGPQAGFNLYLGSVFGLEFRWGLDGILQAGERTVAGFGFAGGGGYVFRLWDDDRKRLKLHTQIHFGFYAADDPGNDFATNAAALSLGLAYERPI
jgi:hypothetical protein